jgi:large subunit ribosomal protein L15
MKLKKRAKISRMRGRGMGTHGTGARKNKKKSGNKGGIGMSGSGKRADHKKTLVQKLYGHKYFGKSGVTSKGTKRDIRERINVGDIQLNIEKYVHQGRTPKDSSNESLQGAKKTKEGYEVILKNYKILGTGNVKDKLNITCFEASASAIEKIEAAGGKIIVKENKVIETPLVEHPKKKKKA